MTGPIPAVDYTATAARPAWAELPAEVHDLVGELCGAAVVRAGAPSGGGFTSGYAGLVHLANRREVFVKAGGPKNNAHILPSYRREAEVLALLPAGLPVPRLLATGETETAEGTYRVLVTQPIRGRMPGQPWTDADLAAVHRTCLTCAELLTPAPAGLDLPTLADQMTDDAGVMSFFTRLAAGQTTLTRASRTGWSTGPARWPRSWPGPRQPCGVTQRGTQTSGPTTCWWTPTARRGCSTGTG